VGLGEQRTYAYTPPYETLAAASSRSNYEALAACVVLAYPHAVFYLCTCGLRRDDAIAVAVIGYDNVKVVVETSTMRRRS
jgi:hypothetical protein